MKFNFAMSFKIVQQSENTYYGASCCACLCAFGQMHDLRDSSSVLRSWCLAVDSTWKAASPAFVAQTSFSFLLLTSHLSNQEQLTSIQGRHLKSEHPFQPFKSLKQRQFKFVSRCLKTCSDTRDMWEKTCISQYVINKLGKYSQDHVDSRRETFGFKLNVFLQASLIS